MRQITINSMSLMTSTKGTDENVFKCSQSRTDSQSDCYQPPLFLPTVLIGDPKPGEISTAVPSVDLLLLRGYDRDVDAIVLFHDRED